MPDPTETPWFREGLRFACTRCGDCCAGTPGYVWVDDDEITRLADHLGLDLPTFGRTYLRLVQGRLSLVEKSGHACVFWEAGEGCTVYQARPDQCQTWPFWEQNLRTPESWKETQRVCPGAGNGPIVGVDEILASLRRDRP